MECGKERSICIHYDSHYSYSGSYVFVPDINCPGKVNWGQMALINVKLNTGSGGFFLTWTAFKKGRQIHFYSLAKAACMSEDQIDSEQYVIFVQCVN